MRHAAPLRMSQGELLAERMANAIGSWAFILGQAFVMALWIGFNTLQATQVLHWDQYPFVFLNLAMSAEAAFTGPVLLIAANIGSRRDRVLWERIAGVEQKVERHQRDELQALRSIDTRLADFQARLPA